MADLNTNNEADAIVMQKALFSAGAFEMKADGDGRDGVIDWDHDDDVGYLLHLKAKANSGSNASIIGIGTDDGAGNGLLISHKNSGAGLRLIQQPGAAFGAYLNGYSSNPLILAEIFKGSGGIKIAPKAGQAINDGVTTSGSDVFTSATAAFTGADVGASISQLTSRGLNDPSGTIPSGTTIIAVTNGTTVQMSANATASATGLLTLIGGRSPAASQTLLRLADESDVTLVTFQKGAAYTRVPLDATSNDVAAPAIKVNGMSGQTSDIFQIFRNGNANAMFSLLASGLGAFRSGLSVNNGQLTTSNALNITNFGSTNKTLQLTGSATQALDQLSVLDSGGATQSRFDKNGYFMTHKTAAPADGDITASSVAFWFDSTDGAAKVKFKGKSANGTVVSGEVALA